MAQNGAFRTIGKDPKTGFPKTYILKPRDYSVTLHHNGTAGATVPGTINIDPDAPFILRRLYMSDSADPSITVNGMANQYENLVLLQDNSNNYSWENQFVPRSEFAGTRELPRVLEDEVLINANTRFTITIQEPAATSGTNSTAADGYTVISLCGYSLYPVASNN